MNELVTYETYEQFKVALDTEILSAAESFVKIGYLLKQARDTTILHDSGYANLYEFAKAEYGIDKGTVSRYIAINDRFSVGGNAPVLEDKYSRRGLAKLQEMLTMSDEVIDAIPEQTTKAEIQEIKRDIREEEEKTDIEVMMEDPDLRAEECNLDTLAKQALYYHLKEDKEAYGRVYKVLEEHGSEVGLQEQIMKAFAPSGVATPRTRVPQVGTILMSIQGLDNEMSFVNVRSNEKESKSWLYIMSVMLNWFGTEARAGISAAERYEEFYGEQFEKVAPAQPEDKRSKMPEKPENIVESAISEPKEEKEVAAEQKQEQKQEEEIAEKPEIIVAENDLEGSREEPDLQVNENEPENPENIVADSEYKECMNEPDKKEEYDINHKEHNYLVTLVEKMQDALHIQDYAVVFESARKITEFEDSAEVIKNA